MDVNVQNLTLFTRRSVKVKAKDEEISEVEIAIPSIREGAVKAAKNEEIITMVVTPSIREGALPGAAVRETTNNEETRRSNRVLTPPIREGTAPADNS